jgi:uracil-DNA glycosylase
MTLELMIVGDFLSRKDTEEGGPWQDGLGRMYKAFLKGQGIEPRECMFVNVFNFTPAPRATMDQLFGNKKEGIPLAKPVMNGKYILAEHAQAVQKFRDLVNHHKPHLILACGDIATWATCSGNNPIDNARGRIAIGNAGINGTKVLPTYAPSQVAASWPFRPVVLADMTKASREMQFPQVRRPQRFLHIEPNLEDMEDFFQTYIRNSSYLSCDIETKGNIITCVGFAPTVDRALVVPFFSETHDGGNYWATPTMERKAWQFVERMLALDIATSGQNFQYDMQYLWRRMAIGAPSFKDDTMLMHHVLQPEMRKGLGFLASIYTDETAWKGMHKVSAADKSAKRGDAE